MSIEQIATDGYLEWAPSRLDIVAIIDKQEKNPSKDRDARSSFLTALSGQPSVFQQQNRA